MQADSKREGNSEAKRREEMTLKREILSQLEKCRLNVGTVSFKDGINDFMILIKMLLDEIERIETRLDEKN